MIDQLELAEKSDFWEELLAGQSTHCRTCGRYAHLDKRRIDKGVALSFAAIWRTHGMEPCYLAKNFPKQRSVTLLKHWGMLVQVEPPEDAKVEYPQANPRRGKRGSWWQITERGKLWITGKISVPRWAKIFDDEVYEFSKHRRVTFQNALKESGFDFDEIMEGNALWAELGMGEDWLR